MASSERNRNPLLGILYDTVGPLPYLFTAILDHMPISAQEVRRDWSTRTFANEQVDLQSEVLDINQRALEAAKFEFDKQVYLLPLVC